MSFIHHFDQSTHLEVDGECPFKMLISYFFPSSPIRRPQEDGSHIHIKIVLPFIHHLQSTAH